MKKLICIILCLIMAAAVFAGCAKKTMTFKEAAEAGKTFIKNDLLKDVKFETEADGKKVSIEGKYDCKNDRAVLSVSLETKDTVQTFKEMIKLDGNKLYIKIPDVSGLSGIFNTETQYESLNGGIEGQLNSVEGLGDWEELLSSYGDYEESEADEDEISTAGDYGFDISLPAAVGMGLSEAVAGKYIMITLPENKPETVKTILSDAEDDVYEKAEKLDPEENYPNVVKYTQKNAYDLMIFVLDGIKEKKKEIASELSATVAGYLGEENFKALNEVTDKPLEDMISDGIDEIFKNLKPEDLAPEEAEEFEVIQKIAYDTDKKLEYVFLYDLKDGENVHNVKSVLTVTAAEEDAAFAEKCAVKEDEIFDMAEYLKNMFNTLKTLKQLQNMF